NLHAVVMHLGRLAVCADALDQPLRPRHRKIAGYRGVMGHDIHVRLQSDIGGHRLADAVGAARDAAAAMDFVDLNDRSVGVVHRASSLTGAAKALDIDHSTAFRRLNALETRLGVRLFERLPGGAYQATPAGERMAAAAERMEDEALAIDRDIAGRDHRLSGRLRVTSSETLAYRKLTSHLARFRQTHPGI